MEKHTIKEYIKMLGTALLYIGVIANILCQFIPKVCPVTTLIFNICSVVGMGLKTGTITKKVKEIENGTNNDINKDGEKSE